LLPPPILPHHVTILPLSPTHSSPADYLTVPTVHVPRSLQSMTRAPSTTTVETHTNTHKGHKTQQSSYLFLHPN
jgi:hypothetical protein